MVEGVKRDCGQSDPLLAGKDPGSKCERCGDPGGKPRRCISLTHGMAGIAVHPDVPLCDVCTALPGRVLNEWYSGLMSRAEVT